MPQAPVPLLLAKGWRSVPPRPAGGKLVWQRGHTLLCAPADFTAPVELGNAGLLDTPFALDPGRKLAYAYACRNGRDGRDYSEIRGYSLDGGPPECLFKLALNKWIPWFMHYLTDRDVILALVATSQPGESLIIHHQLGLFNPANGNSLLVPLPRDAFLPLDVRPQRKEILFYGVEGYQLIDYSGKRLRLLRGNALPSGRGASFHPTEELIALGGRGIVLWETASNQLRQIHPCGQMPVWSPDGRWLYFSESSGDLFRHDWHNGTTERLLCAAGNTSSETHFARKASLSSDGRYLAMPLTRRVRRRESADGNPTQLSEFAHYHALCILDLQRREAWQTTGYCRCAAWLSPPV